MGLVTVIDGNGAPQEVSVPQPGTAGDASGVVAANLPSGPGPYTYQQLLPAATAPSRAGWWVRNRGTDPLYVSEDGTVPSSTNPTSVVVFAGELFPPPGVGYPITQGVIYVAGTAGGAFSCKAW